MYRLAILVLLLACPALFAEREKVFRAGAFAMDITPNKLPISIAGNLRDVIATKVHDPLHARCLVLDDGTMKIAIVICDSCMIPREIFDEAKKRASRTTGILPQRMLMAATHTHTAPAATGVFQTDPDADYVAFLTQRIADGVERANANLRPAKIGWGSALEPKQVFNRRWFMKPGTISTDPFGGVTDQVRMNPGHLNPGLLKPAGPTDPQVSVLSVQSAEGKPLALLANYSLHYVGGVEPVSADYFGAFADRITEKLGGSKSDPPFVGILSNGTSGDVNNVNFAGEPRKSKPYEQIRVVSEAVAGAAQKAHEKIRHRADVALAMAETEIELGVRLPGEKEEEQARSILAEARGKPLTAQREIYARETALMAKYPRTVKVKLQALRIGELGIAAIPCEVFTEIGLGIKKTSPLRPTFTIELANGYNGYLPTPEQHKLGGYETWRARSSYLEVGASTKIVTALEKLLSSVAK